MLFFLLDTCGWFNRYSIGEHWVRKAANNRSAPVGPTTDGQGKSTGHYLIVATGISSIRAELVSNTSAVRQLKRAYTTCHMTFKYYMTGKGGNNGFFSIGVGPKLQTYTTVWRMSATSQAWTKGMAHIGDQDAPFTIDIAAATNSQNQVLAIDDIHFQNCAPPPPTSTGQCGANQVKCGSNNVCITRFGLCDNQNDCGDQWDESADQCSRITTFSCTFDQAYRFPSNCNWTLELESRAFSLWVTTSTYTAGTPSSMARMTGPTNDHTYRSVNKLVSLKHLGLARDGIPNPSLKNPSD